MVYIFRSYEFLRKNQTNDNYKNSIGVLEFNTIKFVEILIYFLTHKHDKYVC